MRTEGRATLMGLAGLQHLCLKGEIMLRFRCVSLIGLILTLGMGGVRCSLALAAEEGITRVLYVDDDAGSANGDGSEEKPFKTIQKALYAATPGTKVFVRAGLYEEEHIVVGQSGTAEHPIVIEGERGPNGEYQAHVMGGKRVAHWEPATEIGDGVYKVAASAIARYPNSMTINGKSLSFFAHDNSDYPGYPDMNNGGWVPYFTSHEDHRVTADNEAHAGGQEKYLGPVKFWDVTQGMFGTVGYRAERVTYIRLKGRLDPNAYSIRAGSSDRKILFKNCQYVTWRGFKLSEFTGIFSIQGVDTHHIVIENNNLVYGSTGVEVLDGAHDIALRHNEITCVRYGDSPSGAWSTLTTDPVLKYQYDLKQAYYQWHHHWIFNNCYPGGISLTNAGNRIEIEKNHIHNGLFGVRAVNTSTAPTQHLMIYSNTFERHSSGAITFQEGLTDVQIFENIFRDGNYAIRNHRLDAPFPRQAYIYNNWFYSPENTGGPLAFHWFSGSAVPVPPPEIYIYHNNFIGGQTGLSFNENVREYGGVPGVHVLNNIFSTQCDLNNADVPLEGFFGSFDYNGFDALSPVYVSRPWFGAHNILNTRGRFLSPDTPAGAVLPQDSLARAGGIDLSGPVTLNGKEIGPLPGMYPGYFNGDAPDLGVTGYASGRIGEVSGDGQITAHDALLVARYKVGLIPDVQIPGLCSGLSAEEFRRRGDVDGNPGLSANDAMLIAQRAVGLIEKFPVEG